MQKLLKTLQGEFGTDAKLTKNGEIKVKCQKLTAKNFFTISAICEVHNSGVEVKRSGTGMVLIFKPI